MREEELSQLRQEITLLREQSQLHKKSGKKAGEQEGHPMFSPMSDEVIVHAVQYYDHCQQDLAQMHVQAVERRQVRDLPVPRLLVQEHQAVSCLPADDRCRVPIGGESPGLVW